LPWLKGLILLIHLKVAEVKTPGLSVMTEAAK
jgi:hypothetical protein